MTHFLYSLVIILLLSCSNGDGKHPRSKDEKVNNTNAIKAEAEKFIERFSVECDQKCNEKVFIALIKKEEGFESCLSYSLGNNQYIMSSSCATAKLRSTLSDCKNNLFLVDQNKVMNSCKRVVSYKFSDTDDNYPQIFDQDFLIVEIEGFKKHKKITDFSFFPEKQNDLNILKLKRLDNSFVIEDAQCLSEMNTYINPLFNNSGHPVINISNCSKGLKKGDLIFNNDSFIGYIVKESECSASFSEAERPYWCREDSFESFVPLHYYGFNLSCLNNKALGFQAKEGCRQNLLSSDISLLRESQLKETLDSIYSEIASEVNKDSILNLCLSYSKGASFESVNQKDLCNKEAPELGELLPQKSSLRWPIRYRVACIKNDMRRIESYCKSKCGTKKAKYSKKAIIDLSLAWGTYQLKMDDNTSLKNEGEYSNGQVQVQINVQELIEEGKTDLKITGEDREFKNIPFCPID